MTDAPRGYTVKLCYVDESGMGEEPIATMVGIVVDAQRMHLTKGHWQDLLDILTEVTGRQIVEMHTAQFYNGGGVWKNLAGGVRAQVIEEVFTWLCERKHHVVYASVVKAEYERAFAAQELPDELNTMWRFLGFHLVLAMQKRYQTEKGVKGHTLFVFDNEEREKVGLRTLSAARQSGAMRTTREPRSKTNSTK